MKWRGFLLAMMGLMAACPAQARDRLVRHFDQLAGLPVASVGALAQDADDFLWIGTNGGLVRWDGREMRPWGHDLSQGLIDLLAPGPNGELYAAEHPEDKLYRVSDTGLEPVSGPDGEPLRGIRDASFVPSGDLYLIRGNELLRRSDRGWVSMTAALPEGELPRAIRRGAGDSLLLITNRGVREIREDTSAEPVFEMTGIIDILMHPDGSLFILRNEYPCTVLQFSEGEWIERASVQDRPFGMALRDRTVWISFTRNLLAIRPDGSLEQLGAHDDFHKTGGPLLVDREGSLWLGNYSGLFQFPEPDTVIWTAEDGLPTEHARFLEQAGDRLWAATWGGMAVLEPAELWQPRFHLADMIARSDACADRNGHLWASVTLDEGTDALRQGLLEIDGLRATVHELPGREYYGRCSKAPDGSLWLPVGNVVLKPSPEGGAPVLRARLPQPARDAHAVLEDGSGTLWAGGTGAICHVPLAGAMVESSWVCEPLPGEYQVKALAPTPSGGVWAATSGGVLRRNRGSWERIPASLELPSSWIHNLVPSPLSGIWIVGHGVLARVIENLASEGGWEILEQPGAWQGIPTAGGGDILEQDDGTLWITTTTGIIQVPPAARWSRPAPPEVRLVDVRVDGDRLPMDRSFELPHSRNRLELGFAALSYRDPSLIRYKVRIGSDARWIESRLPEFGFFDLPPGDYRPEIIASLDGVSWSGRPASFRFVVLAPWYLKWWAIATFALIAFSALYAAYRIRFAVLLRLERQRTRIAMDLHDELGAGLGSIGLLAGLVTDDRLEVSERKDLSGKISATAEELGSGLTDIIWSLRGRSERIEALASYLQERGQRLAPGGRTRFSTCFPEQWPESRLTLVVRRNLQRIAIEALHNAVRHAKADRIVLGMAPAGRMWRLWIEDDGTGMPADPVSPEGRGLGLQSMRLRAAEIGAEIAWHESTGGGTRVEITFDPRGGGRIGRAARERS